MTAFAKPWEAKSKSDPVADAIADTGHKPWDPKAPKVEQRILEQHTKKVQMQGEYRPETKFKAQEFAKQYLIDFDHRAAMIRMGVDCPDRAIEQGRLMLNSPEVLQAIQVLVARVETDKIVSRERVLMGLLKEACFHGLGASHSARVAAWGKLAKVLGMELPPKDEADERSKGGVMLVPYFGGIEEWESAATASQAQLKAEVRV